MPAGRPPYQPDAETAEKVCVLKAVGMSNEAISEAIGISVPTLVKNYSLEMEVAQAKTKAQIVLRLHEAAMEGSVPALRRMLDQVDMTPARKQPGPKPAKLGKKEEADLAAQEPSPEWGEILQ